MDQIRSSKILLSVLVVIVAILSASTLLDKGLNAVPGARAMSQECNEYLDNWTAKSITTFAIAKSINAGLSVVEDSELQLAVVNVAAGEVVQPLNDMIEKVSSVALASAVSLGIQKMLMQIGAWAGLTWFLTASMVCWLVVIWVDSSTLRRLAWGLLLLALVARFLIPAAVLTTGYVGDRFMESAYADAQHELEQLDAEAKKANVLEAADAGSEDTGFFEAAAKAAAALTEVPERVSALISRLASQADIYNEVAITYIVVFIVQTMLMPILILWGLIKLLGYLLSPAAMAGIEARWLPPTGKIKGPRAKSPAASAVAAESQA